MPKGKSGYGTVRSAKQDQSKKNMNAPHASLKKMRQIANQGNSH